MGRPHRIVVLGASGTGKTALVQQLLFGDYVVRSYPGVHLSVSDVYEMCVKTERGFAERMQVYDTPGHTFDADTEETALTQEHFLSIADAFVLVYSVTCRESFDRATALYHKTSWKTKCPISLVGMKCDLEDQRVVGKEEGKAWAKAHNSFYSDGTVKNRAGLQGPFVHIASCLSTVGEKGKLSMSSLSLQSTPPQSPVNSESDVALFKPAPQLVPDDFVSTSCMPGGSLFGCIGISRTRTHSPPH